MKKKKVKKINFKIKNIVILIAIIFLVMDLMMTLKYVGHNTNLLSIVVIAYAIYRLDIRKDKMSKVLSAILIITATLLLSYNLGSTNYLKSKIENTEFEIPVPKFTKLVKAKNNVYTLKTDKKIEISTKTITKHIKDLEQLSCGQGYFYDKEQDITIRNYIFDEKGEMHLEVTKGDYCFNKNDQIKYDTYKNYKEIDELAYNYKIDKFIKDGYVVYNNGEISNIKSYKKFIDSKKNAFVRIVYIEGKEFIISDITKIDGKFTVTTSNKRSTSTGNKYTIFNKYDELREENGYILAYSIIDEKSIKISKTLNY